MRLDPKMLPKNNVDVALDYIIKAGVVAWMVRFVFRANRV